MTNQEREFAGNTYSYRDENVFFKGDRALSKLITLLISNKKEFNHFFKSRSSDIVLLKVGILHQNAKRYEARNTERVARSSYTSEREARRSHISEREARRPLGRAHSCERSEQIFYYKSGTEEGPYPRPKRLPKYFLLLDGILIFRRVIFGIYRPHSQYKNKFKKNVYWTFFDMTNSFSYKHREHYLIVKNSNFSPFLKL